MQYQESLEIAKHIIVAMLGYPSDPDTLIAVYNKLESKLQEQVCPITLEKVDAIESNIASLENENGVYDAEALERQIQTQGKSPLSRNSVTMNSVMKGFSALTICAAYEDCKSIFNNLEGLDIPIVQIPKNLTLEGLERWNQIIKSKIIYEGKETFKKLKDKINDTDYNKVLNEIKNLEELAITAPEKYSHSN